MPLTKGSGKKVISKNISEFHKGKTYAHTEAKFGKKKANKQAVAVALSEARKSKGLDKKEFNSAVMNRLKQRSKTG